MVQVIKDPIGTKGARLSTQISLAGRMLVHLPQDSHIGISQRIEDEAERTMLRDSLTKLFPPDVPHGGFIIRTLAEKATERELAQDVDYLTKLWSEIGARSKTAKSGTLLHQDLSLSERVLRDFANEETQRVLVDDASTQRALLDFAERYSPALAERVQLHQGTRPLFDMYGAEQEIERALHRRVDLKSGGYLIFDQTEALTTIDVNTGGFVGGRSFDDTISKPISKRRSRSRGNFAYAIWAASSSSISSTWIWPNIARPCSMHSKPRLPMTARGSPSTASLISAWSK